MPVFRAQSPTEFEPDAVQQSDDLARELAEQSVDHAEPAPENVIAEIQIEGNVTIETGAILAQVKSQPGREASERQIKEDIRTLYNTRWFTRVERRFRMTDRGMVLVFKVYERPVVRSVQIYGNTVFSTHSIRKQLSIEPGSPFDVNSNKAAASRIERMYREKKSFPNTKVTLESGADPNDRDVIFVIEEGDRVILHDTIFEGNESIRSDVLRTRLKSKRVLGGWMFHFAPVATLFNGKLDEETLPEDVGALREYYRGLGYFDVKVDRSIERNNIDILPELHWTQVNEDEPLHYYLLTFNGLQKKEFKKRSLPYLTLRQAVGATYTYQIAEGQRYRVRDISVDGNHVFTSEDLLAKSDLQSGEYFNSRYLNKDVASITEKYGSQGRLFARIQATPATIDRENGVVDVVYEIDEDKPYTIRKVNVHIASPGGNPHTKERVVQHRIMVAPGDLADPNLIEMSKGRLKGQIFSPNGPEAPRIQVSRVDDPQTPGLDALVRGQSPYDSQPRPFNPLYEDPNQGDPFGGLQSPISRALGSQADLDVYVTEAQSGRLMFGVGVNSNAGVLGQFTLEENNFDITRVPTSWQDILDGQAFRGNGERFRIEAMPGQLLSRYSASWQTSNFLDTNWSFGVSGMYYQRFPIGLQNWMEARTGGRISLGYQLDKWWSFSSALRLEDVNMSDFPIAANTIPLVNEVRGHNTLSSIRNSIVYDTRDSSFMPASGHFAELAYEQAFGQFTYPRIELQGTQHFTVWEREDGGGKHILNLHAEYNWSDTRTPLFERYFAGGYQSFRGFYNRGVSPVVNGLGIGGGNMILASIEHTIPVTADEMIRIAGFVDSGTVIDSPSALRASTYRVTAGFGVRLSIPQMGPAPLAFDFAFPLLSESTDKERVFSFTMAVAR